MLKLIKKRSTKFFLEIYGNKCKLNWEKRKKNNIGFFWGAFLNEHFLVTIISPLMCERKVLKYFISFGLNK